MPQNNQTLLEKTVADQWQTLPSGLTVIVRPMPGYSSTHVIFATRFGSIDRDFRLDGKEVHLPAGVAHFLEHKMFEDQDGDAFAKYAKTGANANAFTSFDRTCYLFTATQQLDESLDVLLGMVTHPYFTEQTIAKEQGIIGQEIKMYDDSPDWRLITGLFECLYHEHPIRSDIAGTVESIAEITPEMLYDSCKAFYAPGNMVLAAAGNTTMEQILAACERHGLMRPRSTERVQRLWKPEPMTLAAAHKTLKMPVSKPCFGVGFKEKPLPPNDLRTEALYDLILSCITGGMSPLYRRLYDGGLVNPGFGGEVLRVDGCCCILFTGESDAPDAVKQMLLDEIARIRCRRRGPGDLYPVQERKVRPADRKSGKCGGLGQPDGRLCPIRPDGGAADHHAGRADCRGCGRCAAAHPQHRPHGCDGYSARWHCAAGRERGGSRMTNLVQFPGLGLSFEINRVALSIGGFNIYWYGVCIAFGICLALVFAFRHSIEFGVDPDSMVDVILIGIVLGIVSARAYYVAMAPFKYESIWEMIAIRDGGLAIYGGIIGGFLFGGLACKRRGVPVLPMFDLTAMGFLLGQGCGRWGNFFNQEAFGCNTTLPWGMFSETTRAYLMGSTVTAQSGVTIDPNLPVHPTFLYESIWCFVGFLLLFRYIKKRKFNGDIALRYMIWYGAGRFWIEALRTDSLMLVPSIGLRVSQLVAGIAVVVGVAAEIYFTHKFKDKPLMVKLAMTADNKAAVNKLSKEKTVIGLMTDADTELLASSPRKLFVERTEAYNAEVKRTIAESGKTEK